MGRWEIINITSPNFPSDYPYNGYRLWDIRAPEGFTISVLFLQFDTSLNRDFLYFGDSVEEFALQREACNPWRIFTGKYIMNMNFTSKSNTIKLIFASEHWQRKAGFFIQLHAVKYERNVTNHCGKY